MRLMRSEIRPSVARLGPTLNNRGAGLLLAMIVPSILLGAGRTVSNTPEARAAVAYVNGIASADASLRYVGSEVCIACHTSYEGWRRSAHATSLKSVGDNRFSLAYKDGIVADYDNNGIDDFVQGLDLNQISSGFDAYKPYAPILKYDQERGYLIRIGDVDYPVVLAQGGSTYYKQNFVVRVPVTDRPEGLTAGMYQSPLIYHEQTRRYTTFNPQYWYNDDHTPRFRTGTTSKEAAALLSFDKSCSGCHFTGLEIRQDEFGEYVAAAPPALYSRDGDPHYGPSNSDGIRQLHNIGCERCHGPGLRHVREIGLIPQSIVNPARDLTKEQQNELCTSCHARGVSKPDGVFAFPFNEKTGEPYALNLGADLRSLFWLDKPNLWPDRSESSSNRQQGFDMRPSGHWKSGVTCVDCHDVHTATLKQLRSAITVKDSSGNNIAVPTAANDNTQCLACHAGKGTFLGIRPEDLLDIVTNRPTIAKVVSAHTFHRYEPESASALSRCIECHMAKVATSAVAYDTRSHTFAVIRPQQTLDTQPQGGMPNSCAVSCHGTIAPQFGLMPKPSISTWNTPADVQQSEWLREYYGPNGLWWRHK